MKIRAKLVSIIAVAVLVPFLLSAFWINQFGRINYLRQKRILYRTIAQELADTLENGIQLNYQLVQNWLAAGVLPGDMQLEDAPPLDMGTVARIEAQWSRITTSPDGDKFLSFFDNALARRMKLLRRVNPQFSELLMTDAVGRLAAASNPTSDYWQADEPWWQAGARLPAGTGISQGIVYDRSAGVLSINIVFPVYTLDDDPRLVGVLKAIVDAEHLFQQAAPQPWNRDITRDICFPDGVILTRIHSNQDKQYPPAALPSSLSSLLEADTRTAVLELYPGVRSLAVAVPIRIAQAAEREHNPTQPYGLYVVVHRSIKTVMAPVSTLVRQLSLAGIVTALAFAALGYSMASIWFAGPLLKLRRAALSISEHIQQSERGELQDARVSQKEAARHLLELRTISRGDELQDLASDFSRMGSRVLTFNRELERELTAKTEEINADLAMAREFQEALLPQNYPVMEAATDHRTYSLHFDHIYRPALSVSGDFFDISKESDHCVRLFVADVMGHGARSALMTAVLHALIHSIEKDRANPEDLLMRMNAEFCSIGSRTDETVFVTAVHMIIDTKRRVLCYSSAGHPPPLLLNHASGAITPLCAPDTQSPAVGLFADATYTNRELPITGNETLLLYTDGVTEAMNAKQEEFGATRLTETLRNAYRDNELERLPRYILENLETFMDTAPTMDDICLVSVDITHA